MSTIKSKIDNDIKQAMLAGEKQLVTTLRGLKSAILYAEVAQGARDSGLSEDEIMKVLAKEAKKRQESADMYSQGGSDERASKEMAEKKIIEEYLPAKKTTEELARLVSEVVKELNASGPQAMGQVISKVKERTGSTADGAEIARITKEILTK